LTCDWLHTEMVYLPTDGTNPAEHGLESNMPPVDYKSDALTTTPPTQPVVQLVMHDCTNAVSSRQGFKTEVFQAQDPAVSVDQDPSSKVQEPRP